jgi:hypothetical protein
MLVWLIAFVEHRFRHLGDQAVNEAYDHERKGVASAVQHGEPGAVND